MSLPLCHDSNLTLICFIQIFIKQIGNFWLFPMWTKTNGKPTLTRRNSPIREEDLFPALTASQPHVSLNCPLLPDECERHHVHVFSETPRAASRSNGARVAAREITRHSNWPESVGRIHVEEKEWRELMELQRLGCCLWLLLLIKKVSDGQSELRSGKRWGFFSTIDRSTSSGVMSLGQGLKLRVRVEWRILTDASSTLHTFRCRIKPSELLIDTLWSLVLSVGLSWFYLRSNSGVRPQECVINTSCNLRRSQKDVGDDTEVFVLPVWHLQHDLFAEKTHWGVGSAFMKLWLQCLRQVKPFSSVLQSVFTLLLGPFTFFNAQKTKYLQILTSLMRWIGKTFPSDFPSDASFWTQTHFHFICLPLVPPSHCRSGPSITVRSRSVPLIPISPHFSAWQVWQLVPSLIGPSLTGGRGKIKRQSWTCCWNHNSPTPSHKHSSIH